MWRTQTEAASPLSAAGGERETPGWVLLDISHKSTPKNIKGGDILSDESEKLKIPDFPLNEFFKGNTKIKSYRDGSCTVIYCDKRIFKHKDVVDISAPASFEEYQEWLKYLPEGELPPIRHILSEDEKKRKTEFESLKKKYYPDYDKSKSERQRTDSMKRAIDKVYDIVFQNDWDYFLTGTIAPNDEFDRNSPEQVYKKLRTWLSHQHQRKGLRYLLIPEYHPQNDEGIHFHALINNALELSDSGRILYKGGELWKRSDLEKRGVDISKYKTVYNCPSWKYGFTTAIPVDGNPARLSCYMTKYITKDCKKIFGKFYLSSRDCVREADITVMNTSGFDDCSVRLVEKFGIKLKYESDFLLKDNSSGRNPTEEILKYLSEREVDVFSQQDK